MTAAGDGRVAAVIDVGSNSVLLLAIAIDDDGAARAIDEALVTTRLAANLRAGAPLDPAAAERTRRAVTDLAARARARGAAAVWSYATGAARRAGDGRRFAAETSRAAGVAIEVLDGEREARLAYAAAVHGLGLDGDELLVVDVGGATTELTLGRGATPRASASVPVGALTLTEASAGDAARMRAQVADALAATDVAARACEGGATLVASGGTPTSIAALVLGLSRYEPRRVHGAILTAADVRRFSNGPLAGTALDPGRAAILPAGACILDVVMAATQATEVRVSDHGVRHAYLRERLAERGIAVTMRALWD